MRRRVDERRRASRLRIALPVRFADGAGGVSRDISTVGIFVDTERVRLHAESVRLSVALTEWDLEGGVRIHGEGRVVRADVVGGRSGLAFDVVWSHVQPLGPALPDGSAAELG